MAQKSLIQQTIKVKKVLKKAQSRFGKASVIVPFNGKDEFLGLNDSVDENAFTEGNSYKVGIAVSKSGKRYIEEVVEDLGADTDFVAPKETTTTTKTTDAEVVTGVGSRPTYKDNSAGQREGAIGHYASRMVAAFISTGTVDTEQKAVDMFHNIKAGIEEKF